MSNHFIDYALKIYCLLWVISKNSLKFFSDNDTNKQSLDTCTKNICMH